MRFGATGRVLRHAATPFLFCGAGMPTYRKSASDAVRAFQSNPAAKWWLDSAMVDDPEGMLAFQRLNRPYFEPQVPRTFSLRQRDKVFTIGSCFARGVEQRLLTRGFQVESAAQEFDDFELSRPGLTTLGFTNKYTTHAILNELRWALDPQATFPRESLVDLGDGTWVDPHTNPTLKFTDLEQTLLRRSIITEVTSRIRRCRLVVVTLGLVEAWRDVQNDVFLNMTPTLAMQARHPERFELQVLGFRENRENLWRIHEVLTTWGHPDLQIVVTVSPVPLMATFTERDVVTANAYSKSVLRAAAEEWSAEFPNVHYFPSYEIVMNSRRDLAWVEDARHIPGPMVKHITDFFLTTYLAEEEPALPESNR
jgi:hypothetical protein